ncbi:saccharopine dehydrogenase family protein [Rhodobacterales bacterium HKCCE3408]|nr:saccharopine dehydrogenase family protein [Rhodobacterales bacterium HKCCE3408]
MAQWRVAIVGAGKIGQMIATLLRRSPNYVPLLIDADEGNLKRAKALGLDTRRADASDIPALTRVLRGHDAVLSAAPFFLTPAIAETAKTAGAHYFDLTEDVAATRAVRELAEGAATAFMPQCGLAPGYVGIAGADLARGFDKLDTLSLRVGALPLYPTNALKYNLTWSTDGLINEYCNPCEVIEGGQRMMAAPLENLETITHDGVDYECFNTSGGLGTLSETLEGHARRVSYRTIRYPGHRDIVKLLLKDLGLENRRDLMRDIFETALPRTDQDVVLVFITATGWIDGELRERTFLTKSRPVEIDGRLWSAIQVTTAAGICGAMDLMRQGQLPRKGFVRQEEVALADFLATEFGALYGAGKVARLDAAA